MNTILTPTGLKSVVLLLALVALWGTAFAVLKVAIRDLSPIEVAAGRLITAAIVLNLWLFLSGSRYPKDARRWSFFLFLSILGSVIPFTVIAWGQKSVSSGTAGLLMGVIPLFTLLLAHFYAPGERMNLFQCVGFLLGFAGIATLMGPEAIMQLGGTSDDFLRQAAILFGAFCYALNAIVVRRLPKTSPLISAAAVMTLGAFLVCPVVLINFSQFREVSWSSIVAVIWLGTVSTAVATVLLYKLIFLSGATFASLMNYLIPCVALVSGTLFLDETIDYRAGFALFLILSGIGISQLLRET